MKVAAVLPCYKSSKHVIAVLEAIGPEVDVIICVDDHCPEKTGQYIKEHCDDPRLELVFLPENQGVGGAVVAGYKKALELDVDIAVKIDSDGQMDPRLLPNFIMPIINGEADYVKGNRFFSPRTARTMPKARLIGNAGLSFFTKFSSGYWSIFDPTNGYTAINRVALEFLELDELEKRYFFESDILMRLNTIRAVVFDVPMDAVYADEESGLSSVKEVFPFAWKNMRNFVKRLFYNYFLRNFSIASVNLVFGFLFFISGVIFGAYQWIHSLSTGIVSTAGSAGLVIVLLIIGFQSLLNFLSYDFASEPSLPLSKRVNLSFIKAG